MATEGSDATARVVAWDQPEGGSGTRSPKAVKLRKLAATVCVKMSGGVGFSVRTRSIAVESSPFCAHCYPTHQGRRLSIGGGWIGNLHVVTAHLRRTTAGSSMASSAEIVDHKPVACMFGDTRRGRHGARPHLRLQQFSMKHFVDPPCPRPYYPVEPIPCIGSTDHPSAGGTGTAPGPAARVGPEQQPRERQRAASPSAAATRPAAERRRRPRAPSTDRHC